MQIKIYGIFVAGGSGSRMGSDTPKQFLELKGIPILQRTIERFREAIPDLNVITVLPRTHFDTWKDLCVEHDFFCPQTLVAGGFTRFHSVKNALAKVPDGVLVFIHDGVRPMPSIRLIQEMLGRMSDCLALIPVLPVVDTLRNADGSMPDPDRSKVIAVQTPQFFHSEDIRAAYDTQAYDTRFTDDASVAQAAAVPVSFCDGERFNIKITTPDDLRLAEAILSLG